LNPTNGDVLLTNWLSANCMLLMLIYDCIFYMDSKFHCSHLESRGVPKKMREIRVKSAGNYIPFNSGSGSSDVISCHFRWCNFRWRHNPRK
jgi:hypothetical protein